MYGRMSEQYTVQYSRITVQYIDCTTVHVTFPLVPSFALLYMCLHEHGVARFHIHTCHCKISKKVVLHMRRKPPGLEQRVVIRGKIYME